MFALKVDKLSALKALKMKMIVTFFSAGILIAGAFALAEDIFSYKVLFAELFKISVDCGLADLLGFKGIGYIVGGEMAVGVFFYIFKYQFALTCIVRHFYHSLGIYEFEIEIHFQILSYYTLLLFKCKGVAGNILEIRCEI